MCIRDSTCTPWCLKPSIRPRATRSVVAMTAVQSGCAAAAATAQPDCTAVIATTDRVALGLIDGLRHHGVQVPEDLAVVGFDDTEAGWCSSPPLATVQQHFDDIGALASRLLIREVRGEPVEHRVHTAPAHFVPRKSCGGRSA